MRKNLVLTITGNDRVGIVEEVTGAVLDVGGNVDSSKMARLGGEFAMLMLVSMPSKRFEEFEQRSADLQSKGYELTIRETKRGFSKRFTGWSS